MMPIDVALLPTFLLACLALVVIPGPDMALITAYTVAQGRRAGLLCTAGIALAGVMLAALVASGLGGVLQVMPAWVAIIKAIGAIYLLCLGIQSLYGAWRPTSVKGAGLPTAPQGNGWAILMRGCLGNLTNPKALLFFSLFLPQFVVPGHAALPLQLISWGVLLTALAAIFNVLLVCLLASIRQRWQMPRQASRLGDGVLGVVFVGLAARLALPRIN
ncbi:threonine/homoserine/homoserine lactone efflux protein [Chitinivorax tropicus]|uniref:Threonine/homoserine/homoserine lactone efflux protein n=1 Tax=Chitinivorax tropicus TaxID=714531 RepID=A0A840MH94_9PROT|nr:LysE family translocator [Chitinivorax tropicus]MBB5016895.1 threonine/homoserine/homoserine lactone efflux protein [Chitinivorax tropicus]